MNQAWIRCRRGEDVSIVRSELPSFQEVVEAGQDLRWPTGPK